MSSSKDTSDGMVTPQDSPAPTTPSDAIPGANTLTGSDQESLADDAEGPADDNSDRPGLPKPPLASSPRRFRPTGGWGTWIGGLFTVLIVGFVLGATLIELPYYAFRPGSVRDTNTLISVDGVDTYPAKGDIGYTTVTLRQATLWRMFTGWLDPDVDVHPKDEVMGDRNSDENRRLNMVMMDQSQQEATLVALEKLGYDVPVSATGYLVADVEKGFPADGVLEVGDTIVAVDGERIDDPDDLDRLMADDPPGDEIALTIKPFDKPSTEEDLELELGEDPEDPERGIMGVQVQADGVEFHFPIDVKFDTGQVGGPSAGLALALGLIDHLTPGELTGGKSVAVTGTIGPDGSVGQIGGAGQKAAAVRAAGMDVFLVPSADYESAKAHAGDVQVIKVDSLDDALSALAKLGGNGLALPDLGSSKPAGESS